MYGFSTQIHSNMDNAVDKVTKALQQEGFGILADINVAATLKAKLDIDRPDYRILGACNPTLANKAIEADPEIGLLLPCNVLLRVIDDDTVQVSFMNPSAVLGLVDDPTIEGLAVEVRARLERVRDALSSD